jgi:hypothetical protein
MVGTLKRRERQPFATGAYTANETPVLIQGLAEIGGNGKGDGQEERGT